MALKLFGPYINKDKEGTRNYAYEISSKENWNLNNFEIIKKFKVKKEHLNDNKKLFKIINLEFLYHYFILKNKDFSISSILSKKGYKYLMVK